MIIQLYNLITNLAFIYRRRAQMFPYLISIPILSEIAGTKEKKLRKMYAQIIDNDCVPLTAIPFDQQEKYAK